jgi:hypothetical protein
MKAYGRMEVQRHVFWTSTLDSSECSTSRSGRFIPVKEIISNTRLWVDLGACLGTLQSDNCSTINSTCTGLGSTSDLRGERTETNRLNHGLKTNIHLNYFSPTSQIKQSLCIINNKRDCLAPQSVLVLKVTLITQIHYVGNVTASGTYTYHSR